MNIDTKRGSCKGSYHKKILFSLPNVACTIVTNKANQSCDRMVSYEETMAQDSDEGLEDDDGGQEERDDVSNDRKRNTNELKVTSITSIPTPTIPTTTSI